MVINRSLQILNALPRHPQKAAKAKKASTPSPAPQDLQTLKKLSSPMYPSPDLLIALTTCR